MPLIETTALGMRYDGKVTALTDLTLEIEAGVVGLVGVDGAGKSKLIKLALGLLGPTSGRSRVLGLDPIADGERVRAKVGYMPEHDCLPPDMVAAEFVTHMARVSGLPAAAVRERASENELPRRASLTPQRPQDLGRLTPTGKSQAGDVREGDAVVTGTDTATDNRLDLAPAATGTPAGARVSRAAVADPTVSVWGIAAAAVQDHTPADRPAHERARGGDLGA